MSDAKPSGEEPRKLGKKIGLKRKRVEPIAEGDLAGVVSGGNPPGEVVCNESKIVY